MSTHQKMLPRYHQLRLVMRDLNEKLTLTLERSIVLEGAAKLNVLKGNSLVLDSEHMMTVLMDFCLHDLLRDGKNAVDRYLANSPPPPGSDAMLVLQGMKQGHYRLLTVERCEPGVGVHVRNLLRNETLFVHDIGISQTAPRGLVLASRIVVADGIAMSAGSALPIAERTEQFLSYLSKYAQLTGVTNFAAMSAEQASTFWITLIRLAFENDATSHIQYQEPGSTPTPRRSPMGASTGQHVGRNEPCPCGSRRKFKQCCGKPQ